MSFNNPSYILYIAILIVIFSIAVIKYETTYFKWVKVYWNYTRTKINRISSFLYLISMALFLISLLDLRGPEEYVKTNIPDQKTIIIIDSSASMLAEDIKPSRFSKAIQLARHFVKNSPGHQIAIVLFSDVQKRLMPFTDDIDLVDSRLAALDQVNSVGGGSNIAQAIQEATGYFQTEENKVGSGNILVFTDAEESDGGFNLKLESNYNLAVVGIGTAKGAQIPIRWKDGSLRGYKEDRGEKVITKLDESYIKNIGKDVANYKHWIANSYSIPTTEITNFFRTQLNKSLNQGDTRIRPVYSFYILIPAILIFIVSVVLSRFQSLKMLSSIVLFLVTFIVGDLYAKDSKDEKVKENPLVIKKINELKTGKFVKEEALYVAQEILKLNDAKKSAIIYEEYLDKQAKVEEKINAVSSFLLTQKNQEAFELSKEILSDINVSEKNKSILKSNIVFILSQNGQGKGEGNKDDKSEDKDNENNDKKDKSDDEKNDESKKDDQQKSNDSSGEGDQDNKDDKQDSKSDSNQKNPKDSKNNKDLMDDKKKDKEEDNKKNEGEQNGDPKEEQKSPQSLEEKEQQIKDHRKMIKTPAMIKQILNDDRELQKQMMDTSTDSKGSSKKDW